MQNPIARALSGNVTPGKPHVPHFGPTVGGGGAVKGPATPGAAVPGPQDMLSRAKRTRMKGYKKTAPENKPPKAASLNKPPASGLAALLSGAGAPPPMGAPAAGPSSMSPM